MKTLTDEMVMELTQDDAQVVTQSGLSKIESASVKLAYNHLTTKMSSLCELDVGGLASVDIYTLLYVLKGSGKLSSASLTASYRKWCSDNGKACKEILRKDDCLEHPEFFLTKDSVVKALLAYYLEEGKVLTFGTLLELAESYELKRKEKSVVVGLDDVGLYEGEELFIEVNEDTKDTIEAHVSILIDNLTASIVDNLKATKGELIASIVADTATYLFTETEKKAKESNTF